MYWRPGEKKPPTSSKPHPHENDSHARPSQIPTDNFSILDEFSPDNQPVIYNPRKHLSLSKQVKNLPIHAYKLDFLWSVETSRVTILAGETGSGKSTQLPQYLDQGGWTACGLGVVVVVPRRIAAVSLASRVSEEMGTELGREVGYITSDEYVISEGLTRIRYITDGVMMRLLFSDPLLMSYSVIVMDDSHERRSNSDTCLALLKKIIKKRCDLRVVVTSATVDIETFINFFKRHWVTEEKPFGKETSRFDLAPISSSTASHPTSELRDVSVLSVSGRCHPVDVYYLKESTRDYMKCALETVLNIHCNERSSLGGILVFLTGKDEVETLARELIEFIEHEGFRRKMKKLKALDLEIVPLYASQSPHLQLKAFVNTRPGFRKCILSTNIAESSVTIENISFVVDCGFVKTPVFDDILGFDVLAVSPISKSSATQRAGRAGRTQPGSCYRLYPRDCFDRYLPEFSVPEISRTDLSETLLYLLSLGITNLVSQFDLPTPISSSSIESALDQLFALEAINDLGQLTSPMGQRMAELPLSPKIARMVLLASQDLYHCVNEALIIAAMLSCPSPWLPIPYGSRTKRERLDLCIRAICVEEGDFVSLYNIYKQSEFYESEDSDWMPRHMISSKVISKARKVFKHLTTILKFWDISLSTCGEDTKSLMKVICGGFFLNVAQRQRDGSYKLVREQIRNSVNPGCPPANLMIHSQSITYISQPLFVVFREAIMTFEDKFQSFNSRDFAKGGSERTKPIASLTGVTVIDPRWLPEVAGHYFKLNLSTCEES